MASSIAAAQRARGRVRARSAGIHAGGQVGHRHVDVVLLLPLVEPVGGGLPGRVGVEGQHDPPGEAACSSLTWSSVRAVPQVATARGTPARGEADDVGVALADDDLVGVDDVVLGPVQAVEDLALGVERVSGVFRYFAPSAPGSMRPPKADRIALGVEDREQHPAAEEVLHPAAPVQRAEPGVAAATSSGSLQRLGPAASQSSGAQPIW